MSCEHRHLTDTGARCTDCGITAGGVVFSLHDRIEVLDRELVEAKARWDAQYLEICKAIGCNPDEALLPQLREVAKGYALGDDVLDLLGAPRTEDVNEAVSRTVEALTRSEARCKRYEATLRLIAGLDGAEAAYPRADARAALATEGDEHG